MKFLRNDRTGLYTDVNDPAKLWANCRLRHKRVCDEIFNELPQCNENTQSSRIVEEWFTSTRTTASCGRSLGFNDAIKKYVDTHKSKNVELFTTEQNFKTPEPKVGVPYRTRQVYADGC